MTHDDNSAVSLVRTPVLLMTFCPEAQAHAISAFGPFDLRHDLPLTSPFAEPEQFPWRHHCDYAILCPELPSVNFTAASWHRHIRGGRCNRREFRRGRIDSGGDTSAGCDTIPQPKKGGYLGRARTARGLSGPRHRGVLSG